MIKKNFGLVLLFILVFTFAVKADVPPIPGFGRVDLNLILGTKEDLSDYRFFLDFHGDLKEIKVNDKSQTTIPPMGGGARYADGTLLAIPRKNLNGFANDSTDTLRNLSEAIRDNKIEGIIKLTTHTFRKDAPLGINLENNPTYLILREGDSLKLVQSSDSGSQNYRMVIIIAGVLIALAVLIFGLFLFRKASKKV